MRNLISRLLGMIEEIEDRYDELRKTTDNLYSDISELHCIIGEMEEEINENLKYEAALWDIDNMVPEARKLTRKVLGDIQKDWKDVPIAPKRPIKKAPRKTPKRK